jgi:hypothetical protein
MVSLDMTVSCYSETPADDGHYFMHRTSVVYVNLLQARDSLGFRADR